MDMYTDLRSGTHSTMAAAMMCKRSSAVEQASTPQWRQTEEHPTLATYRGCKIPQRVYAHGNPYRYLMRYHKHIKTPAARLLERNRELSGTYIAFCRSAGMEIDPSCLQQISYDE